MHFNPAMLHPYGQFTCHLTQTRRGDDVAPGSVNVTDPTVVHAKFSTWPTSKASILWIGIIMRVRTASNSAGASRTALRSATNQPTNQKCL